MSHRMAVRTRTVNACHSVILSSGDVHSHPLRDRAPSVKREIKPFSVNLPIQAVQRVQGWGLRRLDIRWLQVERVVVVLVGGGGWWWVVVVGGGGWWWWVVVVVGVVVLVGVGGWCWWVVVLVGVGG